MVDTALGEFRGEVLNPLVFIACKRPVRLSSAGESQLFEYALNRGVPLLVLTDGGQWDLYLAMAVGEPARRRLEGPRLRDGDLVDVAALLELYCTSRRRRCRLSLPRNGP